MQRCVVQVFNSYCWSAISMFLSQGFSTAMATKINYPHVHISAICDAPSLTNYRKQPFCLLSNLLIDKNNKFLRAYDDIFLLSDWGVIVLTLSVMSLYFNEVFPLVLCFFAIKNLQETQNVFTYPFNSLSHRKINTIVIYSKYYSVFEPYKCIILYIL